MSETNLDRNRNRLGYQRTTIACGHCRRRKIRCVASEHGTEQRCLSCIRLNKECIFGPVDEQPARRKHSETSSRMALSSTASSSSPHLSNETFSRHGQQDGSRQSLHLEVQSVPRGVPIAPSISPAGPGSLSAPIPQTRQFGPEHPVPPRHAYPPPHGHVGQPWEHFPASGSQPQLGPVPMPNAASMQFVDPSYHDPALQVDTAPFPNPTDLTQAHPAYGDGGMYSHHHQPEPHLHSWQQQGQPTFGGHYQQQDMYRPQPQQSHCYVNSRESHLIAMDPLRAPRPVQQQHELMHPNQDLHLPPRNFLPTQREPTPWHPDHSSSQPR